MSEPEATITARGLNRASLARQMLSRRERIDPCSAVRRLLALQAQHPASPYLALWNRIDGFDPDDLDAALADAELVRATSLRTTLHLFHRDDHGVLHRAMRPTLRAARLGDRRFTDSGLTTADADVLVEGLVRFAAEPRTTAELTAWLRDRVGEAAPSAWWALRSIAPLRHAVTGGPWGFGYRPSYVAADVDGDPPAAHDADDGLPRVVRRYLAAFGPASIADVSRFTMTTRTRVREAVTRPGDELVRLVGPGGAELLDVPDGPRPADDTPAPPRLLPMWDSLLLAYDVRARVLPEPLRRVVIRTNGDVLPSVLVDGTVGGVWRPVDGGIEVRTFTPLDRGTWRELAEEADGLRALLAVRDPSTYSRYRHWWDKLPEAEVRRLP